MAAFEKRHHAILTGKEILPEDSGAAFNIAPLIGLVGTVPPEVVERSRKTHKARVLAVADQFNREIAEDPHGFILRQGWATLDFSDEAELAQLRRLHETLQLEIIAVLESLNRLRESPDYELCQLSERKPSLLDELAAERKKLLEKESAELRTQANKLAEEIKELAGKTSSRIV